MPKHHVHTRHERIIVRVEASTAEARDTAETALLVALPAATVEGRMDVGETFTSLISTRLLVRYGTAAYSFGEDPDE